MSQISDIFPCISSDKQLKTVIFDGRFQLVSKLGYGGQSEVFLAEDLKNSSVSITEEEPQLILPKIDNQKRTSSSSINSIESQRKMVALKVFKDNTSSSKIKQEFKTLK
jgi:serine/threonine protein kinase